MDIRRIGEISSSIVCLLKFLLLVLSVVEFVVLRSEALPASQQTKLLQQTYNVSNIIALTMWAAMAFMLV